MSTLKLASPGSTRIGFIGIGVMGLSMAGHLIKAGYKLSVFTRTASKADSLVSLGASVFKTPREVAQQSDVVISIVGYPKDVEEVLLNDSTGVLPGFESGKISIDMTTSKPSLAARIYDEFKKRGAYALDAPVSGRISQDLFILNSLDV
jgi:3-hydroxyisobutyrate dehydrogenase